MTRYFVRESGKSVPYPGDSHTILASPQTSIGVSLMRDKRTPKDVCGEANRNECVTNEPQRTSAGRLIQSERLSMYGKLVQELPTKHVS